MTTVVTIAIPTLFALPTALISVANVPTASKVTVLCAVTSMNVARKIITVIPTPVATIILVVTNAHVTRVTKVTVSNVTM